MRVVTRIDRRIGLAIRELHALIMLRDSPHAEHIFLRLCSYQQAQLETGLNLSPAFVVRCERAHAERRFGDPHQVGSVSCSAMGWELSGTCSQIVPTSGGCCPGLPGQPGVGLRQWAICPTVLATPQTDGGYQVRPCRRCDVWTDSTERATPANRSCATAWA